MLELDNSAPLPLPVAYRQTVTNSGVLAVGDGTIANAAVQQVGGIDGNGTDVAGERRDP